MTDVHRTVSPPASPAPVVLTPDVLEAVTAARSRASEAPAEALTIRLGRPDAEALYGIVASGCTPPATTHTPTRSSRSAPSCTAS
jgi:hypothetical protein